LVATNLGLFKPMGDRFLLREIAPGVTVEQVRAATGAPVEVPPDLKTIRTL
jgi:acyl CoA:acetate/3-ketoacid CoA transferase beta subunit